MQEIFARTANTPGYELTVDLRALEVRDNQGSTNSPLKSIHSAANACSMAGTTSPSRCDMRPRFPSSRQLAALERLRPNNPGSRGRDTRPAADFREFDRCSFP